jgi:hypothetical protein
MNNRRAIDFCRLLRPCCNRPPSADRPSSPMNSRHLMSAPDAQDIDTLAIRCMEGLHKAVSRMLDNMSMSPLGYSRRFDHTLAVSGLPPTEPKSRRTLDVVVRGHHWTLVSL